jgi:hypothetical protein
MGCVEFDGCVSTQGCNSEDVLDLIDADYSPVPSRADVDAAWLAEPREKRQLAIHLLWKRKAISNVEAVDLVDRWDVWAREGEIDWAIFLKYLLETIQNNDMAVSTPNGDLKTPFLDGVEEMSLPVPYTLDYGRPMIPQDGVETPLAAVVRVRPSVAVPILNGAPGASTPLWSRSGR